ncbi:N-acetylneuraminate lyase-like isoform X1 [Amphiura filiformis]|uniref:N-acetylneuraminate lyase-like isoform X1 n=1 Tax=Amphiura filiformis TaxID=82378 RepID=UPI003B227A73
MGDFKLKGLVAAPFTPFHENGDLNLTPIEPYMNLLLADGVKSVFICGTTGEGPSMTLPERKSLAEKWVQVGKDKLDAVVVHVGCGNLRETIELAKHAKEIGASAIASIPSVFFKPKTIDLLVDYMREISLAAPDLPLYYYHIPGLTGTDFPMYDFMEVASTRVPNLAGIKFSHVETVDLMRCLHQFGEKYQFLLGTDSLLLPSMTFGSEAFVGSTYNFCGKPCNRVIAAFKNKDLEGAQKDQFKFLAMVKIIVQYGLNVATQKAMMSLSRIDLGPTRAPIPNTSAEQKEALKKDLTEMGYFEWIN